MFFCSIFAAMVVVAAPPGNSDHRGETIHDYRYQFVIDTFSACRDRRGVLPCLWFPSRNAVSMFKLTDSKENYFLSVSSNGDATSIARECRYSLREFPYLIWRWRIHELPKNAREDLRSRSDSGAGVYVIFSGTILSNTVIKYVWSTTLRPGTKVTSPFNQSTWIVVLRQGTVGLDRWKTEKVNVFADYQRLFDRPPPDVMAIGLMSDSDNTRTSAQADYDDFYADSTL